jgi:SAM-dependent methyltransferase
MSDTRAFYDDLADVYHLIHEDWPASIERQADALSALIREHDPTAAVVADVACGIGTQALGLAARGYRVLASDLSARALDRLQREARDRNVTIDSRLDDMQELSTYADGSVDVLLACDNAIPHLLSGELIARTFRRFHRVVRPGGLCILSVRDYAAMPPAKVRFYPYGVREIPGGKVAVFQVWEYEGDQYRLNMYFVFDRDDEVETRVFRSRYYTVSIDTLLRLFADAGFRNVRRLDDVLFQPVIVGER